MFQAETSRYAVVGEAGEVRMTAAVPFEARPAPDYSELFIGGRA